MKQRLSRQFLYILLLLISKTIVLLPLGLSLKLGKFLGFLAYLLLPKFSDTAKKNLKMAFSAEKSPQEINRIAKEVFCNLGMNAVEVLSIQKIKKQLDKKIYAVGFERVDEALKNGKGAIMLSAHFGNWELIPMYSAVKGYPSNVIARRIYYKKYDEFVTLLRNTTGVNIIYRDESPKKILKALKNNELLGIIPDQDMDSVNGVFVNFFNQPAYTPTAPVMLAMKIGSPILPCFIIRENSRHKMVIEERLNLVDTGNPQEDIVKNTQNWSSIVESYIRKYPEQWVWMHRRWKTKPDSLTSN